ncbi:hypothetical protein A6E01_19755 (plasmid) [Vibrio breoganii]|uniref:Conjugal transfer protein TraF n=1 Tax=Vibrio breoganii TaxID=553239 RepID=A0AAN1CUB2_9VIBR|nr:conjugal transfer protein TraF [Vibrio breoganii]ANO35450.1 hypothetical protein A6E01_19755 [Vibrio breoganii]
MQLTKLTLAVATLLAAPAFAYNSDAQSLGMAGIKATTSTSLASGANPAILSADSSGFIRAQIPVSIGTRDQDDVFGALKDAGDLVDDFKASSSREDIANNTVKLNKFLDDIYQAKPITVDAGSGFSVEAPNRTVGLGGFIRASTHIVTLAHADKYSGSHDYTGIGDASDADAGQIVSDTYDRLDTAYANIAGVAKLEIGGAISHRRKVGNKHVSVGFSPKIQSFQVINRTFSIDEYELSNLTKDAGKKTAVNLDIGTIYDYGKGLQVGFLVTDVVPVSVKSKAINGVHYEYEVKPQATIGATFQGLPFVNLSADYQLNESSGFKNIADNTQYLSVAAEANVPMIGSARLGYQHDLNGNANTMYTAGVRLGFVPFLDMNLGGAYSEKGEVRVGADLTFKL